MYLNLNGGLELKLESGELKNVMNSNDIIVLCESWTNECSEIEVDGFAKPFCKHRKRKKGAKKDSGGIVCYFRNEIVHGVKVEEWDFEDGLCFRLDKCVFGFDEDLLLFCVYMRASSSTREDMNDGLNCYDILLDKISSMNCMGGMIVVGDMNARTSESQECIIDGMNGKDASEDMTGPNDFFEQQNVNTICVDDLVANDISVNRVNEDKKTNEYGSRLVNLCLACDLIIMNGRAGSDRGKGKLTFCNHRGVSAIDYVLSNKQALYIINDFCVQDVNCVSDHCMLSFKLSNGVTAVNENVSENPFTSFRPKWREEKKSEYKDKLMSNESTEKLKLLIESMEGDVDVSMIDKSIAEFSGILVKASVEQKESNGVKRGSTVGHKKNKNWFDKECKESRKIFKVSQKQYYEERSEENRVWMCSKRSEYRKLCRVKRQSLNRAEAQRLLELSKRDPSKFWKEVRVKKRDRTPDLNFSNHFRTLAGSKSRLGEEGEREVEVAGENREGIENDLLDRKITMNELEISIKSLKRNKACGHDYILNEFILNASLQVKVFLLLLFNSILTLEYFPSSWAVGSIIPVFKKGDKNDVNNYRGITLLSCLSKLFTRIINNRLNEWAESEEVLTEAQFGFRKERSTSDCLFILHGLVEILLARGKKLYCCFIDYEKAYDYIDRAALFYKLTSTSVSSKCVNIIKSMYSKIKLEVRGQEGGSYFSSTCGLLQGESTSPILFSLFVNDLELCLQDNGVGLNIQNTLMKLLMFADDTVIFSETRDGLQAGLNSLYDYCIKWGITVNAIKTKIVVFRRAGRLSVKDIWYYGNQAIDTVSSFKYLGFNITSGGSFAGTIKDLTNSARRAMFGLKSMIHRNPELLPSMQISLFNTLVSPILNYGSEVWGMSRADPIEKLHLSFLKTLLYVKQSTPNCFVYGELGVYPLFLQRQIRVIKLWLKILRAPNSSFLKLIYNEMLSINTENPRTVTWVSLVKNHLFSIGLGMFWERQQVFGEDSFLRTFSQRIHDIYLQNWSAEVMDTSENRLFKHIKQNFCLESYLNMSNKGLRVAITKIRLSSHVFMIERARWNVRIPKLKDRVCAYCNVIESEYHVLIECPRFTNERYGCVPQDLIKYPNMSNFKKFLTSSDENIQVKLGSLCFRVLKAYKEEMLQ